MNLLQVRTALVNRSGRHDLVVDTTDYVDNGFNDYIQQGQRWLDRKYLGDKARGKYFDGVTSGDVAAVVPDCRVIEEVWMADSEERFQLKKVEQSELRGAYGYNEPFADLDTGQPYYYSPTVLRMVPEVSTLTVAEAAAVVGFSDVMFSDHYGYNGVLWMPPADGSYTVEVIGWFYHPKLTSDTDTNNWSEEYPEILMMAAMRQVEIFNRNTEGRRDWEEAINLEMKEINSDAIQEESEGFSQMEG